MIRVNLLPQKREQKREAGQGWLLAVMGVMLLEIIGLFFFHRQKQEELETQKRTNAELTSQIDQIKKTVANHADIKAQLEGLRQREDAIDKLQTARTGPTAVLLEVARILTRGQKPTVDEDYLQQQKRDNPTAVPNFSWDPRRLWLLAYGDTERLVRMEGLARDGDDVSELARRLTFSKYFTDVKLLPASKTRDGATNLDVMHFEISAKAKY